MISVSSNLDAVTAGCCADCGPKAVNLGLDALLRGGAWPAGLAVATVGKGSEAALAARGFRQVIAPASGFDSGSVLALPAFQAPEVAGKRVLILRGDGGRDLLGDTLRARGAEVEYLTCYHRRGPVDDPAPLLERARSGRLDALTLTSSEGLDYLQAMPGGDALLGVPVFVPHPRIGERARQAGFARVSITAAGDSGLIDGLIAHFSARNHNTYPGKTHAHEQRNWPLRRMPIQPVPPRAGTAFKFRPLRSMPVKPASAALQVGFHRHKLSWIQARILPRSPPSRQPDRVPSMAAIIRTFRAHLFPYRHVRRFFPPC